MAGCLLCCGCPNEYVTPGRGADLKELAQRDALTEGVIGQAFSKRPTAILPCSIATVRIQANGFDPSGGETYGSGSFCVVATHDVESSVDLTAFKKLPMLLGVAPLNRLSLPEKLNSDLDLRQGAAALHADMLLIYTFDTTARVDDHLAPLTVVTLGLAPDMSAQIVTTVSAVLMDTRTGYIYGYADATEKGSQLTDGWMAYQAVGDARRRTESLAYARLVDHLSAMWGDVVKNLSDPKAPGALIGPRAAAEPDSAGILQHADIGSATAPRDMRSLIQIPATRPVR